MKKTTRKPLGKPAHSAVKKSTQRQSQNSTQRQSHSQKQTPKHSQKQWKKEGEKVSKKQLQTDNPKKKQKKEEEFEVVPVNAVEKKVTGDSEKETELRAFDSDFDENESVGGDIEDTGDNEEEEGDEIGESEGDEETEARDVGKALKAQNRKGKKSGGFQSMGLSYPLYKAIQQKGYKIPTPIQRKAIPVIQEGGDVVAMARTGSGKTAAFLIPMIEKLKAHSAKVGARSLVLSPSRELAQQTLKFVLEFAKHTDLRACCLVGGDNLDDHFAALASNPDIIIATPGRLMHLIIETKLQFKAVEYVVFDEADRLFELGFSEQLKEILTKLPTNRQTLLFSATLPKILVDFARAGLQNPTLIRLDVDTKISTDLQMYFFQTKQEEKNGVLVYLLSTIIPSDQQTVIFVATKHHVEFINELLVKSGFSSTFIYGSLDQAARKINLAKFKYGKCKILVVTDVAARGIDIPMLDNVINYDFPASSKVFVHRVGRTARAGRSGNSFSLVANDELPYMLDLQLFTGRSLVFANQYSDAEPDYTREIVFGSIPLEVELEVESVATLVKGDIQLETLMEATKQGTKMYLKSRPTASKPSYQRSKEILLQTIGIHPFFQSRVSKAEIEQFSMLKSIQNYRPSESIFELGKKGATTKEALLMQKRRKQLHKVIQDTTLNKEKIIENDNVNQQRALSKRESGEDVDLSGFKNHVTNIKEKKSVKDEEYYLSYRPKDDNTEKGYAVHAGEGSQFTESAHKATLDIVADDENGLRKQKKIVWDSKTHRFKKDQIGSDNKKRIKTESGTLVAATFKQDRYEKWQKKTMGEIQQVGETEDSSATMFNQNGKRYRYNTITTPKLDSKSFQRKAAKAEADLRKKGLKGKDLHEAKSQWLNEKKKLGVVSDKKVKSELKSIKEVAKEREAKEKRREKTGRHKHILASKKKQRK